jgi:hypothetical protein
MHEILVMNFSRSRPEDVFHFSDEKQLGDLAVRNSSIIIKDTGPYELLSLEWNASSPSTQT